MGLLQNHILFAVSQQPPYQSEPVCINLEPVNKFDNNFPINRRLFMEECYETKIKKGKIHSSIETGYSIAFDAVDSGHNATYFSLYTAVWNRDSFSRL
jgi:hypothetical protein